MPGGVLEQHGQALVVTEPVTQEWQHRWVIEEVTESGSPPEELVPEPLAVDALARQRHALCRDDGAQVLDVALREHAVEYQVAVDVEEVALLGAQAVSHPPIVPWRRSAPDGLDAELDLDRLADEQPTALQDHVPAQVP